MNSLRWRLTGLVLLVSLVGMVASFIVTTRVFIKDKHSSVLDLSSMIAPGISNSMAQTLNSLEREISRLHEVYVSKPSDVPGLLHKNPLILQLDVFEESRRLTTFVASDLKEKLEVTLFPAEYRYLSSSVHPGAFTLQTRHMGREKMFTYVATVSKKSLEGHLQTGQALTANLMAENGALIFESPTIDLPKSILRESIQSRDRQSVQVKEVDLNQERALVAISPIPKTQGAAVVVAVSMSDIELMAFRATEEMIPFGLSILILVLGTGLVVSTRIARPLEKLTSATLRMAQGQWSVGFDSSSSDEVGKLVRAFSKMGLELGRRERALKDAQDELVRNEKLATLGQFSAGIAHEVKNPLNSILGFTQLLQRKFAQDAETLYSLNFIADETRRTNRIISDLLSFSRQRQPVFQIQNLNDVAKHAFELAHPQARKNKVEIRSEFSNEEISVNLDREQIYQVLLNMLVNAFHALESKSESPCVHLRTHQDSHGPFIEIEDNGSGISEANLKKLFEPFFTTKKAGHGAGLGLSICYGIMKSHGGKIEVSSQLGQGTCFRLRFPRLEHPPASRSFGQAS